MWEIVPNFVVFLENLNFKGRRTWFTKKFVIRMKWTIQIFWSLTLAAVDVCGFSMRSHRHLWYFANLPVPKSSSTSFLMLAASFFISSSMNSLRVLNLFWQQDSEGAIHILHKHIFWTLMDTYGHFWDTFKHFWNTLEHFWVTCWTIFHSDSKCQISFINSKMVKLQTQKFFWF